MDKSIAALHLIPQQSSFWTLFYSHSTLRRLSSSTLDINDLFVSDIYQFTSLTKDSDGLSVVVSLALSNDLDPNSDDHSQGERMEIDGLGQADKTHGPWAGIKIAGPLDFGLTGILNELTIPLRKAQIGIYAISTWDTDYVLVPQSELDAALDVLSQDGWTVVCP